MLLLLSFVLFGMASARRPLEHRRIGEAKKPGPLACSTLDDSQLSPFVGDLEIDDDGCPPFCEDLCCG